MERFVTIRFNSSTTAVNGTYNGVAASATPYGKTPGSATGGCLKVYCHSDGKGTYAAPVWNQPATGVCGTCHRVSAATSNGAMG